MTRSTPTDDDIADRLATLLDLALRALQKGDELGALLIMQEAEKCAQRLPKRLTPAPVSDGQP